MSFQKVLDALAAVSAFFNFISAAIFLEIMLPLGASERVLEGAAARLAFDKKEIVFGIIFFAVWTYLYYSLAKEYIPKGFAIFSSVVFLGITYISMLYTVREVGYENVLLTGGAIMLLVLAVVDYLFPHALNRFAHLIFTDFLGIGNLRKKFRIVSLCALPFGICFFFTMILEVLEEGLSVLG